MDTFIDKLSQKKNAQGMILANMSAEAAKMERLQNQMQTYDELMQEIRQVNLKTAENLSDVQKTLKEYLARLEALQAVQEKNDGDPQAFEQLKELLEEKFKQSDEFLHRENVKVYRNVQAAVTDELNKQTDELKKSQAQNRTGKAVLPVCVMTLIAVLADIVIHLLNITIPM